jgi:hypothetical protein
MRRIASDANDPRVNDFGRLARVLPNSSMHSIADLMAYEQANDPDKASVHPCERGPVRARRPSATRALP